MNKAASMNAATDNPFARRLMGKFDGLLRWPELDDFWGVLKQVCDSGWYIYTIGEHPPARPASKMELLGFIAETDALIRRLHEEDYCGIVYVDDRNCPNFVQIFHPKNMGYGTCSLATTAPLPCWILSTEPPSDITVNQRGAGWLSFWGGMMATLGNALSAKRI